MKVIVTATDADGGTRFEDREVAFAARPFAPPAAPFDVSAPEQATALAFVSLPAGWTDVAHPSPRCQTLMVVTGAVRVTTSDGAERDIAQGDVWRMEDTTGRGHHTRVISRGPFIGAIVQHE